MKPYVPQSLPRPDLDYARLIRLVGPANAALARYDGLLQSVINPSVLSSKIERTQATVDEDLVSDPLYAKRFVYKIFDNLIHKALCADSMEHKTSRDRMS